MTFRINSFTPKPVEKLSVKIESKANRLEIFPTQLSLLAGNPLILDFLTNTVVVEICGQGSDKVINEIDQWFLENASGYFCVEDVDDDCYKIMFEKETDMVHFKLRFEK